MKCILLLSTYRYKSTKNFIRLFGFVFLLLAFLPKAHAATCPISSGASSSTIVSTITGCASGNTVTFAAGTYTLSATVSVPCGVSITGPTVLLSASSPDGYIHMLYNPTAIIVSSATPSFSYGTCSTASSFEFMEVNGSRPSTGGQAIYISSSGGVSNLTISYNYFHGNNWSGSGTYGSGPQNASLILFDGSTGTAADVNDTVSFNRFGANGDCATVMSSVTYSGFGGDGGYCNAIGWHTNLTSPNFNYNFIYYQEEGIKGFEGGWVCTTCTIEANDFSNFHRIGIETQIQGTGTSISYLYNSMHDPFTPGQGTFGLSSANGCSNTHPTGGQCTTIDTGNTIIDNVAAIGGTGAGYLGLGIEFWSSNSSSGAFYNLVQGQWSNSIDIATDGSMTGTGNLVESSYGAGGSNTPANCYPGYAGAYGWWATEDSPANTPVNGGSNVCHFYDGSVQTSATPSISPASGTFTGSQTVTLNNSGTNLNAVTTIWYTVDGSTPIPGTGTAHVYTGPFSVTTTTTVKAVGMWGAPNQPTTYPTGPVLSGSGATGYGFKPSSVISATYTSSSGGATATPIFTPASESFYPTLSVSASSSTSGATLYCTTDGSTPTTSSPVYSSPFNLTATTTLQCIATASGYTTSSVGSATYTYTPPGPETLGNPIENTTGVMYPNLFNAVYAISPNTPSTVSSCEIYQPVGGTVTSGSKTDCLLVSAPSTTTMASTPICYGTWTNPSATGSGWETISLSGCGVLPANTAYWVVIITNDPLNPGTIGYWNCGGSCQNTTPPTTGNGTYSSRYVNGTYGSYSSLPTTLNVGGSQPSQYLNLAMIPLTSCSQTNSGPVTTVAVGSSVQQIGKCFYSSISTTTTCSPTADIYGNSITSWGSNDLSKLSIGAVGTGTAGQATGVAVGTASTLASVGTTTCANYSFTITHTLTSLSIATTGSISSLAVGATNQLIPTCYYNDGTNDNCSGLTIAYTSSVTSYATVTGSGGLVTGVAPGTTNLGASIGAINATALPLTIISTTLKIQVDGIKFQGKVFQQ